jgi:hypothetical protein
MQKITISLIYNLDSRPKFLDEMTTTADCDGGCRCVDFFTHGLLNKINFLTPHELEVIVYIDVHEPIPEKTLEFLEQMKRDGRIHKLIMKPHTTERFGSRYGKKNNDLIYAESLSMATGDYVVHFDSDIVAYKKSGFDICAKYFELLEQYAYVSIPSLFSPNCIDVNSPVWKHLDYMWASTRFIVCKRKTLPSLDEMLQCFDNNYLNKKYGTFAKPNCVEHILGLIAGRGNVFYPSLNLSNYLIVSWVSYWKGVIEKLNTMPYDKIYDYFINQCGGIYGANDVCGKPLGEVNE